MAIRHLKFLQERINASERQAGEEHFRAGYQEAVGEALRYLAETQGFPTDGICAQLASHLKRHCEIITKGEAPRHNSRSFGSSSETASSSCSSLSYTVKPGVIQPPPGPHAYPPDHYEPAPDQSYPLECDRVATAQCVPGGGSMIPGMSAGEGLCEGAGEAGGRGAARRAPQA
ncbi:unnamed protein product [Parnassius apollo]|uniref:(apollo) hypothetical protein n=1 Tax=Parnassius apollo TaxID=110799 RepID=A0A8S3WYD0_PARAO|nr:unnamed protein product [Parnassius apollo]